MSADSCVLGGLSLSSCGGSLDVGENTNISNYYENTPTEDVVVTTVPTRIQTDMDTCDGNENCKYIAADFSNPGAISTTVSSSISYAFNTEQVSLNETSVISKIASADGETDDFGVPESLKSSYTKTTTANWSAPVVVDHPHGFRFQEGSKYTNTTLLSSATNDVLQVAATCTNNPACIGFSYNPSTRVGSLYSAGTLDVSSDPDLVTYKKVSFTGRSSDITIGYSEPQTMNCPVHSVRIYSGASYTTRNQYDLLKYHGVDPTIDKCIALDNKVEQIIDDYVWQSPSLNTMNGLFWALPKDGGTIYSSHSVPFLGYDNLGSSCLDVDACNLSIMRLIQSGTNLLSTKNIQACQGCPSRHYTRNASGQWTILWDEAYNRNVGIFNGTSSTVGGYAKTSDNWIYSPKISLVYDNVSGLSHSYYKKDDESSFRVVMSGSVTDDFLRNILYYHGASESLTGGVKNCEVFYSDWTPCTHNCLDQQTRRGYLLQPPSRTGTVCTTLYDFKTCPNTNGCKAWSVNDWNKFFVVRLNDNAISDLAADIAKLRTNDETLIRPTSYILGRYILFNGVAKFRKFPGGLLEYDFVHLVSGATDGQIYDAGYTNPTDIGDDYDLSLYQMYMVYYGKTAPTSIQGLGTPSLRTFSARTVSIPGQTVNLPQVNRTFFYPIVGTQPNVNSTDVSGMFPEFLIKQMQLFGGTTESCTLQDPKRFTVRLNSGVCLAGCSQNVGADLGSKVSLYYPPMCTPLCSLDLTKNSFASSVSYDSQQNRCIVQCQSGTTRNTDSGLCEKSSISSSDGPLIYDVSASPIVLVKGNYILKIFKLGTAPRNTFVRFQNISGSFVYDLAVAAPSTASGPGANYIKLEVLSSRGLQVSRGQTSTSWTVVQNITVDQSLIYGNPFKLEITDSGNLVLKNSGGGILWKNGSTTHVTGEVDWVCSACPTGQNIKSLCTSSTDTGCRYVINSPCFGPSTPAGNVNECSNSGCRGYGGGIGIYSQELIDVWNQLYGTSYYIPVGYPSVTCQVFTDALPAANRCRALCPPGQYETQACSSPTSLRVCSACPATKYCPGTYPYDARPCTTSCSVGTIVQACTTTTDAICEFCPPGYYCPDQTLATRTDCPAGSYCPRNSTQPTPCRLGKYCPTPRLTQEEDCPVGYYCPDPGIPAKLDRTSCPKGYKMYQPTYSSSFGVYLAGPIQVTECEPIINTSRCHNIVPMNWDTGNLMSCGQNGCTCYTAPGRTGFVNYTYFSSFTQALYYTLHGAYAPGITPISIPNGYNEITYTTPYGELVKYYEHNPCVDPCPQGQYETASCDISTNTKTCSSCTPITQCYGDRYIVPCTPYSDTFCRPCTRMSCAPGSKKATTCDGVNNNSCVQCLPGTYSSGVNSTTCSACLAGTYSSLGQNSCTPCPVNTFSGASASSCTACPPNQYAPAGSSSCLTCPDGSTYDSTQQMCVQCLPGYSSSGGAACSVCPAGYYSDVSGATSCTPCPSGTYSTTTGSTVCQPCAGGRTTPGTGAASCSVICPNSLVQGTLITYLSACLATACQVDPNQTIVREVTLNGSSCQITQCAPGYSLNSDSWGCTACPQNDFGTVASYDPNTCNIRSCSVDQAYISKARAGVFTLLDGQQVCVLNPIPGNYTTTTTVGSRNIVNGIFSCPSNDQGTVFTYSSSCILSACRLLDNSDPNEESEIRVDQGNNNFTTCERRCKSGWGRDDRGKCTKTCAPGYYCPAGSTYPMPCPAGYYCPDSDTMISCCTTRTAEVETFAGNGTLGSTNTTDKLTSTFGRVSGLTTTLSGNVYVIDNAGTCIRNIQPSGVVTTLAGVCGTYGYRDILPALFNYAFGLVSDIDGNIYVADASNHRIRKITPGGVVTTLFGDGSTSLDGLNTPTGIAIDMSGTLYIANKMSHTILRLNKDGTSSRIAGSGVAGYLDGNGLSAMFDQPTGVAVDLNGKFLYVTDYNNYRIRQVNLSNGTVSTFAGSVRTLPTVDGTRTTATFNSPLGIAVDSSGYVYVTDTNSVRVIDPEGNVSTLAGSQYTGFANGTGSNARFNYTTAVAFDRSMKLYVSDYYNYRIRKLNVICSDVSNTNWSCPRGSTAKIPWNVSNPMGNAFGYQSEKPSIFNTGVSVTYTCPYGDSYMGTDGSGVLKCIRRLSPGDIPCGGTASGRTCYENFVKGSCNTVHDSGINITYVTVTNIPITFQNVILATQTVNHTFETCQISTYKSSLTSDNTRVLTVNEKNEVKRVCNFGYYVGPSGTCIPCTGIRPKDASTTELTFLSSFQQTDYQYFINPFRDIRSQCRVATCSTTDTNASSVVSNFDTDYTCTNVCKSGYGRDVSDGHCVPCTSNDPGTTVTSYQSPGSCQVSACTTTVPNGYTEIVEGKCRLRCNSGYTLTPTPLCCPQTSGDSGTLPTSFSTGTCTATACTTTDTNALRAEPDATGVCRNVCKVGTFKNASGACQTCPSDLGTSVSFIEGCTLSMCQPQVGLDYSTVTFEDDQGVCRAQCRPNYVKDSSGLCTLCATGYARDSDMFCTLCIPGYRKTPDGLCEPCPKDAGTTVTFSSGCTGSCTPTNALTTIASIVDGVCRASCKTGYIKDSDSLCTLCDNGYTMTGGACQACPVDQDVSVTYSFGCTVSSCSTSDPNSSTSVDGAGVCRKLCNTITNGFYSKDSQGVCSVATCNQGYNLIDDVCTVCDTTGTSTCPTCPAATPYWNGSTCVQCAVNTNCTTTGQSGVCNSGTCSACNTTGTSTCPTCPAATPYWNGTACKQCVIGTNCTTTGQSGVCSSGTCSACSTTGTSTCGTCPAGTTFWNGSTCVQCIIDTFCAVGTLCSSGACTTCPTTTGGGSCPTCPASTPCWTASGCSAATTLFMSTEFSGTGTFNRPIGIARGYDGTFYISDTLNHCIRQVSRGVVTTIAGTCGTGGAGYMDGPGSQAKFNTPQGIAVRGSILYVADSANHVIRKVDTTMGSVGTYAGIGTLSGFVNGNLTGSGTLGQFNYPTGIALNALGQLYVADQNNHAIRYIDGSTISTVAGGFSGYADGGKQTALFNLPSSLVTYGSILYVLDSGNSCVRKIVGMSSTVTVTTFAGSTTSGYVDGTGTAARFSRYMMGITADTSGNLYVTDSNNKRVRKITPQGVVTTIAGNGTSATIVNGVATSSTINFSDDINFGSDGNLYVLETYGPRIRKIYKGC